MAMIGSPPSFPQYPASQQNRYPQSLGLDPLRLSPMPELLKPSDLYKPDLYQSMANRGTFPSPLQPSLSPSSSGLSRPAISAVPSTTMRTPLAPLSNPPASPFNNAARLSAPASSPFVQPFRPFNLPAGIPGGGAKSNVPASVAATAAESFDPADETGEKIGKIVAAVLKDNPALQDKVQEKVDEIDIDAIQDNIGPRLEAFRASVQPGISKVPKAIDRRLINLVCGDDPAYKQMATDLDDWLRKPIEPGMAANSEAGMKPHRAQSAHAPMEDEDPFATDAGLEEDPALAEDTPPPKRSMIDNLKSKVWPFNKESDKENIDPAPKSRTTAGKKRMSDEELDAMLNESFGEPAAHPPRKRARPALEDEQYY